MTACSPYLFDLADVTNAAASSPSYYNEHLVARRLVQVTPLSSVGSLPTSTVNWTWATASGQWIIPEECFMVVRMTLTMGNNTVVTPANGITFGQNPVAGLISGLSHQINGITVSNINNYPQTAAMAIRDSQSYVKQQTYGTGQYWYPSDFASRQQGNIPGGSIPGGVREFIMPLSDLGIFRSNRAIYGGNATHNIVVTPWSAFQGGVVECNNSANPITYVAANSGGSATTQFTLVVNEWSLYISTVDAGLQPNGSYGIAFDDWRASGQTYTATNTTFQQNFNVPASILYAAIALQDIRATGASSNAFSPSHFTVGVCPSSNVAGPPTGTTSAAPADNQGSGIGEEVQLNLLRFIYGGQQYPQPDLVPSTLNLGANAVNSTLQLARHWWSGVVDNPFLHEDCSGVEPLDQWRCQGPYFGSALVRSVEAQRGSDSTMQVTLSFATGGMGLTATVWVFSKYSRQMTYNVNGGAMGQVTVRDQ